MSLDHACVAANGVMNNNTIFTKFGVV